MVYRQKLNELDYRLSLIKPPCEFTRCPQNIDDKLKASEWKNFIIYYSMIVLKGILPKKYYEHWFLLVYCTYTLLKPKLSVDEYKTVEKTLKTFHDNIEKLYGE